MVRKKAEEAVAKLPRAYGGTEPRMSRELNNVADNAETYRKDLKDDYLSVEQFHSGHHLTHRTLLERDVVIVEGLMLGEVPAGEYELRCLPLRLAGLDGAPARAVLVTNE